MADTKLWLTVRLGEDGNLAALSIAGSRTYMDDDPIHRTREAMVTLNLLDAAALDSARAMLVRVPPPLPEYEEARTRAMAARDKVIPELTKGDRNALEKALKDVLDTYTPALRQMLGRAASGAEAAAYLRDVYDADGNPIPDPRMPRVTFSTPSSDSGNSEDES